MAKKSIITGITGQDGAYLALLLDKGYVVYGAFRRTSSVNFWRVEELGIKNHPNLHLVEYDLTDLGNSIALVQKVQPDEIYNLAAQSFVGVSFDQPNTTAQITGVGALNLLEAIRLINPKIRFYQASTSEMFGKVQAVPQKEDTPFYPRSPYGVAKLYAHWMTVNYRESYGIFGSSGILFNHESPLRGREFVTRKITDGVAKIQLGQLSCLELGNIDAQRDWGFAKEYVEGMLRMMQADEPDTFVLATNRTETVREFVRMAFKGAGIEVEFKGKVEQETAVVTAIHEITAVASTLADASLEAVTGLTSVDFAAKFSASGHSPASTLNALKVGQTVMRINPQFYRPAEVELLIGDPSHAKAKLGWAPTTSLEQLCQMMVEADLKRNAAGFAF
jgi:GDPmannose 4,6-dehydratase